jgi:hypothetical protein
MIYNQKYTPVRDRKAALNYLEHLQGNSSNKLRILDVEVGIINGRLSMLQMLLIYKK